MKKRENILAAEQIEMMISINSYKIVQPLSLIPCVAILCDWFSKYLYIKHMMKKILTASSVFNSFEFEYTTTNMRIMIFST